MFFIHFFLHIKTKNSLYQNISEEEKDTSRIKAQDRYQNLTEKKKEKKRQYHRELNKNLSEEQKHKS